MATLTKREMEELRPTVDSVMQKTFGFSDPTVIVAALNCVGKGMDENRTADMLKPLLEESAPKFVHNLFDVMSSLKANRKRSIKEEGNGNVPIKRSKYPSRFDEEKPGDIHESDAASTPQADLTHAQIKEMMANARNQIIARKDQIDAAKGSSRKPTTPASGDPSQQLMSDALEKAKRAASIQARINASMASVGLAGALAAAGQKKQQQQQQQQQQVQAESVTAGGKYDAGGDIDGKPVGTTAAATANFAGGPTPLILDDAGRTVDASGKAIQLTQRMPTLKANIRAKRRQEFKITQQEKPQDTVSDTSKFFDPRVLLMPAVRQRRGFKFHEEGKFRQVAQRVRAKSQLERLQSEIAMAAKKTGISSATKLALITPKKDLREDEIPDCEWWDSVILPNDSYSDCRKMGAKFTGITHLVEHPIQMKAPVEPTSKPANIQIFLTKKERKKLRRQRRKEGQKEVQEKIRLGLEPPPEPKVRMANLMRVLGNDAVQDPTKVEAHVRAQMAKRQRTHEEANAARKLTKEQRSEKKINKIKEDTSAGVVVAVYKLRNLRDQAKRFKVETNAKQLHMTGIAVLHKDVNVIVVEGGPKQQKKFKRLMLNRIKWNEDKNKKHQVDSDDSDDESRSKYNKCDLVWEGTVKQRSFSDLHFKFCPTESAAREQFRKHSVEHYWALSHSQSILETADDT